MARIARRPLERFLRVEAASGIVLLLSAAAALIWANSPWAASYNAFWHTGIGVRVGNFRFERSLTWVVNDGLMVIFFFVVGLEIRRELHQGELATWRKAALPAIAAIGGMLAPAAMYLLFASAPSTHSGWGVPMATDIAFAVGVLTLLGNRVPKALRVLLLALAVIDDLGAIVVIAIFYSGSLHAAGLMLAALAVAAILAMQWIGVRSKLGYVAPAVVAWAGVYGAGVHPTIAGVIIGTMTPVRAWLGREGFLAHVREALARLRPSSSDLSSRPLAATLQQVGIARREAISPAESLIETLHPWVAFGIMPIFALANAGVPLHEFRLDDASLRVALGIGTGLVLGKPIGVLTACWLTLRLGLGALPTNVGARQLSVLGSVAGVGFTMSLFIAHLAFTQPQLLAAAKVAILIASAVAAAIALAFGRGLPPNPGLHTYTESADDVECADSAERGRKPST